MLFKTNTIVGHRGCRMADQSNTIEAFERGMAAGAEMLEMDVRKTRDDVLVVFHDPDIKGVRIRGNLYEDMAGIANQEGKVLPTLEEVLTRLAGKSQLMVELKEAGYEELVMTMLLKHLLINEFVVTSFMDEVLMKIKKGFPTVKTGLILGVGPKNAEFTRHGLAGVAQRISEYFPWQRLKSCGADFMCINYKRLALGILRTAHKRGVQVMVWTVNDPGLIKKLMLTHKVNCLITDRPDLAVEIRKSL